MATRAARRLTIGLLAALALLGVTGLYLAFEYGPASVSSTTVDLVRVLHEASAYVALVLGVLVIVATRGAWQRGGWTRATWVAGSVLVVAALGYGIARGSELAWDQLALWAVVPGEDVGPGVWLPSTTKFVIVDGSQLTPSAFETAAWIHTVVLALVIAAALTTVLLATRTPKRAPSDPEVQHTSG